MTYQVPSVSILPTQVDDTTARVRLSGEFDIAAEPILSAMLDRLRALDPRLVIIDLAAVTFAGSTFVNLMIRLRQLLPSTTLLLCRPPVPTRKLLELTGIASLATLHTDLPLRWLDGPPSWRPAPDLLATEARRG